MLKLAGIGQDTYGLIEAIKSKFHPFYVKNEDGIGEWKAASNLKAGDELLSEDGNKVKVEKLAEEITVYNLELDEVHTYFVAGGVLVHNGCGGTKSENRTDSESGSKAVLDNAKNNGQPLDNHRIVPDTEASSLPATKQTPNSSADLLNPDGSVKQRRYYDADGKAEIDIDFNHTDDGTHEFPHIHIWDWSKKPPRQDSRN